MRYKSKTVFIFTMVLILSGLIFVTLNTTSCTKTLTEYVHDTTTVYDTMVVHDTTSAQDTTVVHDTTTQNIVLCSLYKDDTSHVKLISNPTPDPNSVDAKKEWGGNSITFSNKRVFPGYVDLYDGRKNTPNTTYTIKVTSNIGNAQGSVVIPDSTHITQPQNYVTLPIGDVTVSWATSHGADFYWFSALIRAYDNSYNVIQKEDIDTFLTTVSYDIPASHFHVSGAAFYEVDVDVFPEAGIYPTPGATGNMTGSLKGFLTAEGKGDEVGFQVGQSSKASHYHKKREITAEERRDAYLHALGIE